MKKGSNPPPPDISSRPQPSPSPPPKKKIVEFRHINNTSGNAAILLAYLDRLARLDQLESRLQFILDEVTEIKKTVSGGK